MTIHDLIPSEFSRGATRLSDQLLSGFETCASKLKPMYARIMAWSARTLAHFRNMF